MTETTENKAIEFTPLQLQVLSNLWAQARTVELRRREGGIGYVTTVTRAQAETQDAGVVASLLAVEALKPHYKNYFKIVIAEGTELPAPVGVPVAGEDTRLS